MILFVDKETVCVFDLDDTLISEYEYLKSAYADIAKTFCPSDSTGAYKRMLTWERSNLYAFQMLKTHYKLSVPLPTILNQYREHVPKHLYPKRGSCKLLNALSRVGVSMGVITDGRSSSQRNKLRSSNLIEYFEFILISEETGNSKPDKTNFETIEKKYPSCDYIYFGDNYVKDFIYPKNNGWLTIGIEDDGTNIHTQSNLSRACYPHISLGTLDEINLQYISS